jgi:iron complex outermembrane receptor protein
MGTDNLWQTGFDFSDAIDDDGVWSYRLTGLGRSENAQQEMAKSTRYAIAPLSAGVLIKPTSLS